ncbi:MAG: hypothetical protein ACPICB_06550 [Candidatus Poseidoniaceae archaeon]
MIESIRTISKALGQTNHAFMCLKDLSDVLFSDLDSMNKSFSNSFQTQRILNDQFRAQCSLQIHENQKLMFVASKIASEPQLVEQEEIVPLLGNLAELDASLQDGEFGRPIPGFLHPKIAEIIIDVQYQFQRNSVLASWDDWRTEFTLLQLQFQRLIELFPIEHPVSSMLVSIHLSLDQIVETIREQIKILHTIQALTQHSSDVTHSEHAAYFRLHVLRLEDKLVTLPVRNQGDEEE